MNTNEDPASPAAAAEPTVPEMARAGLVLRGVALLIDYLVTVALFAVGSALLPVLPSLAVSLGSGALYFSLCHSFLGQGQSFGKKLIGLRVISGGGVAMYLTPGRALLRYLAFIGGLMLLVEIPPVLFRAGGIAAAPWILQLPMLAALLWLMLDAGTMLSDPAFRTLHDRIAGSIVVRSRAVPTIAARQRFHERLMTVPLQSVTVRRAILAQSSLIAVMLWGWGIILPKPIENIARYQFVLERSFPDLRVATMSYDGSAKKLSLDLLALVEQPAADEEEAAHRVVEFLRTAGAINPEAVASVVIRYFHQPHADGSMSQPIPITIAISGAATP